MHLREIWGRIGIGEIQQEQRVDVVIQHLDSLLEEMRKEEVELEEKLLKNIETYINEQHQLCQELSVKFEEIKDMTVLKLEKELRNRVEQLVQLKNERIGTLRRLQKQEKELCDSMLINLYNKPMSSVPTPDELEEYKLYVNRLQDEKLLRQEQFQNLKHEIVTLLDDLESSPNISFERDVICEDEITFLLSTENIDAMKKWKLTLEEKKNENNILANCLRERLIILLNQLMVEESKKEAMLFCLTGQKPSNIQTLHSEIAKCEQLKKERTKELILNMRQELLKWWDICKYAESQKNFSLLQDENFSEALLERQYAEINKVKLLYEECKPIFLKIEKRDTLWMHKLDLEARSNDPNRYNNRGGTLLQEEKERKKMQKEFVKLEKELETDINEWERKNNRPFRYYGKRFLALVENQRNHYEKQKEIEKEERQKAKAKQREEEMLHGSHLAKRKMFNTPTKTPSKLLKLNGNDAITPRSVNRGILTPHKIQHSSLAGYNTPTAGLPPKPPSSTKIQRNRSAKEKVSHKNKMANIENGIDIHNTSITSLASSVTSYAEFSNALNQHHREFYRSSLICSKDKKTPLGMRHLML